VIEGRGVSRIIKWGFQERDSEGDLLWIIDENFADENLDFQGVAFSISTTASLILMILFDSLSGEVSLDQSILLEAGARIDLL